MFKNFLLLLLVFFFAGCSASHPNLATVTHVELQKYSGTWYEVARFEHFFEKGCKNVSASYDLQSDSTIKVINRCVMIKDEKQKEAVGVAYALDATNAKLKVSFFRPFYGDYWILDLADDYSYALVGAPNREYLWILSRSKQIDEATKNHLLQKISSLGFDRQKLLWTVQE